MFAESSKKDHSVTGNNNREENYSIGNIGCNKIQTDDNQFPKPLSTLQQEPPGPDVQFLYCTICKRPINV